MSDRAVHSGSGAAGRDHRGAAGGRSGEVLVGEAAGRSDAGGQEAGRGSAGGGAGGRAGRQRGPGRRERRPDLPLAGACWPATGVSLDEVAAVLEAREGTSGVEEKARREGLMSPVEVAGHGGQLTRYCSARSMAPIRSRAWFGRSLVHDAKLKSLELASGAAAMRLHAFRMTDKVDDKGFFVLDKHALVSFEMADVTGLALRGTAPSLDYLSCLRIRPRPGRANSDEIWSCAGPQAGDFEIAFNSSYGLEGSIYGRELSAGEPLNLGLGGESSAWLLHRVARCSRVVIGAGPRKLREKYVETDRRSATAPRRGCPGPV